MKKNILKIFAVLLALVMLFALASCGGNDKEKYSSETTGTTENADKEKSEGKLTTEQNNQAPTVTAGAVTNGKDGSAKSGGKDPGKDPGKSDDNKKSTGSNTSKTYKPNSGNASGSNTSVGQQSGGKTEETASTVEPEGKDNEGEFVIPSAEIQLPVVPLK